MLDEIDREIIRQRCESDLLFFTRYFFKKRQGIKFIVNWHHVYVAMELQAVMFGETENLILNMAPGSGKTEEGVINLIAQGMAINPFARFLHLSSSDDLALLNSQTARDIVLSDEFQELWPMRIAADAKAKKRWNVIVDDKKAGGVYATSLGGQVTGFRAGHMVPGFSGLISVDDPLKADSAFSNTEIKTANRQLLSTVKSRKANPKIPMIITMQRLSEKDCTGFIMGGNLPGKWKFVSIPALIDDAYVSTLPPRIAAMVDSTERDSKGRFSYWPYKEPLNELLSLEAGNGADADGNRISKFVFNSQYQQKPTAIGGNIIKGDWFPRLSVIPTIKYRMIYADTAQKTAERNDYSVFECWGALDNNKIILLDLIRGKWEAPDLKNRTIEFWNKHRVITGQGALRKMKVEDKSSGTGLIQDIKKSNHIPIEGIERNRDKLTRVMDAVPHIESGHVCLIEGMSFNSDFINECEAFTSDDSHAFDDQVDPLCDAISDMLSRRQVGFFSR